MRDRDRRQIVVVGGGAAGLMAAIFAARGGGRVLLLEGTPDGGRKILISGGGRCNILPSSIEVDRYVTSSSRNSLRKLLLAWPLEEQRSFFENDLGVPLTVESGTGKLFPVSNRARDVRDALVRAAERAGVDLVFDARVSGIELTEMAGGGASSSGSAVSGADSAPPSKAAGRDTAPTPHRWIVRTGDRHFDADRIVLATGGLSVPKTGSDGWGLSFLKRIGHNVVPPYPALTPLTADPAVHAELAGVSLRARLSAPPPGGPFESDGGFLFTHRGWSGPAVLNISHLAVRAENAAAQPLRVRWEGINDEEWMAGFAAGGARRITNVLREKLPARLADRLLLESGVDGDRPLAHLRKDERTRLIEVLTRYELPWTGDEGYRKAEVTGGGVHLSEVRPDTLESRVAPGLFLCGELLDAFGPIGGYNFAWAWATGRAAGKGIVKGEG